MVDDLVLLYQDRKIHLTHDRIDAFLGSMRSKLKIGRADPAQYQSTPTDLPTDAESLEKIKKSQELRGQSAFKVAGALVEAYAKNRDFVRNCSCLRNRTLPWHAMLSLEA